MTAFRWVHPAHPVRRAASWLLWTDGGLDDLLAEQSSAEPGMESLAMALRVCHEAGIDVTAMKTWVDVARIVAALPAGELRAWLVGLAASLSPRAPEPLVRRNRMVEEAPNALLR